MSFADVFEVQGLREQLALCERQLGEVDAKLAEFAREAPTAEAEARGVLATMPQVGPVTTDVVLSELGDWRRFRNAKQVVSFAGLDPGCRQSAGKSHQLHITKEGSRLLRWAMIQAAWRLVGVSPRWSSLVDRVKQKTGSPKKAIVAVARHVLCVMFAMLRQGKSYQMAAA
jgi:transposase